MTPRRAPILLALGVPLAVLHAGVLAGGVYFQNDVHLMWLAGTQAVAEALLEGAWPFWAHRAAFGEPLLANANNQVLYPPAWPGLLLPPGLAYSLLVLAHHAWMALGALRLAREIGLRGHAALLVAALTVAIGPVASLAPVWNQLCGFAWVPWATLLTLQAVRTGSGRALAGAGGSVAAAVLAGSPEAAASAAAGCLLAASVRGRGAPVRSLALGIAAVLLGAALSAPQWLTTLHAARDSARSRLPAAARLTSSVHPDALPALVVPLGLAGQPLSPERRLEIFGGWDPLVVSPYLGGGVLLLAALAVSRRPAAVALGAGTVLALLSSLGSFGPFARLAGLPVFDLLRYPSKALILAGLALPLLAGLGFQRADRLSRAALRARVALALAVVALAPAVAIARLGLPAATVLSACGTGVLAAALAAALLLRATPRARLAAAAVAALDLLAAHAGLHATAPAALLHVRSGLLDHVGAVPDARLYAWDYFVYGAAPRHLGTARGYELVRAPQGWHPNAAQALGLRIAAYPPSASGAGVSGSFDRDVAGLGSRAVDELRDLLHALEDSPPHDDLLRLASVSHVVAMHTPPRLRPVAAEPGLFRQPVRLFAVPDPLPRARVVDGVEAAAPPLALVSDGWDPARSVRLDGVPPRAVEPAFDGGARVLERSADRLVLEVSASSAAHLVLAEAWDRGWSARVGGSHAAVLRANHAFMAVPLPAGNHRVELRYVPPGLAAGLWACAAGAAAAAVLARSRVSAGRAVRA